MELFLERILLVFICNAAQLVSTANKELGSAIPFLATDTSALPITDSAVPLMSTDTSAMPITNTGSAMPLMSTDSSAIPITNTVSAVPLMSNDKSAMPITNTGSAMPLMSTDSSAMPITNSVSAIPLMSTDISAMPITDTNSVTPLMSTKTVEKPLNCPSGFVQCADGKCEPYESLCGEKGIVTITFPTVVTTHQLEHSTRPIVSGSSVGTFESSSAVTETTVASAATTSATVQATTSPVVLATDSNGHEICLDGWEMCMDGTCEPFHWLCTEHDGSANFTTIMVTEGPTTNPVEIIPSNVTGAAMTDLSKSTVPMIETTTPEMVIETTVTDIVPQIVTSSSGTCPNGFVQCVDGTCEPFEALCGEGGIVTVTFPTVFPTTESSGNTLPASGSSVTTKSTFESVSTSTTIPTTTTTFAVATDSSGKEVCADGWEQCKDGTCEPFHWLCTEHDGSSPIIG